MSFFLTSCSNKHHLTIISIDEANTIFKKIPFDIDFSEQNVIIYAYRTIYFGNACILKKVQVKDNICSFLIKEDMGPIGSGSASSPITRILVITMDKINVDNYNFVIE